MKKIKFLTMGLLFIGMATIVSCKKEDMSKYATKDELNNYATNNDLNNNQAKVFNYDLTFPAGSSFETYDGITGFEHGDIIVTYMYYENLGGNDNYWVQLPFYDNSQVNIYAEYSEKDGFIYINAELDDGSAPWTSSNTMSLKSVLIKASALKAHPNVNLSNFKDVKKAFKLK